MFLGLRLKRNPWVKALRREHPYLSSSSNSESLRLILGVGRSGTSWVSQVLSKSRRRCRFFSEPLFHIAPRLPFHAVGDHTAVGYEEVAQNHPLDLAYRLLTHRQFKGSGLTAPARNDDQWEICLVKEVHALLGTEGLLRAWRCPAILILRDPVYIADSLFAAQSLQSIYLDHEVVAAQQERFLERFALGHEDAVRDLIASACRREVRQQIILKKVICVGLIQSMFRCLAQDFPFVRIVQYETLCQAPGKSFPLMAEALSLPWDDDMDAYLQQTTQGDGRTDDHYSVVRNTAQQKERAFKFLSPEEISLCRLALDAIGA